MDPNHWSNYNQAYGRLPGSLSAPHSAFPLLDQTGLGSSLGLTHSLQPHAPLPQRALGSLPGVNYAAAHHPALHSSAMSQIIESMSPLTGSFNAQSLHKGMSLGQNLVFDSVRADQQIPSSAGRYSSASSAVFSPSKSSLFAEEHAIKEPPHSYSSPSVISQSPSVDSGHKGWGLSNFMPPPSSNPFGAISSMDLSGGLPVSSGSHRSSQPPPAHSSASRHSAIQRNPFSSDSLLEASSRSGRGEVNTPSSPQVHSLYGMMGLSRQHGHSSSVNQHQMEFHGIPSQAEIEDLSSGAQQQAQMFYAMSTYGTSTPTNTTSYAASQLSAADINYDPVSPATPLSENQPGETAFPTTVSFADLNAIGANASHGGGSKSRGGPPGLSLPEPKEVPAHLHSLMMPQPHSRGRSSKSQVQQMSGNVNSPHQHSPISVGSPQAPMSSIGSPQNVLPSSTVKAAAPPVQAMADSSTTAAKPKKPRARKKPKTEILKNVPPPQSPFSNSNNPGFLSSSQGFSNSNNYHTSSSRNVGQFQPPDNQTLMQTQSPQAVMRMRGNVSENMSGDGNYQVMSSVGNNQVSPISDQSPRSQQQGVETPTLLSLSNVRGSVDSGIKNSSGNEPMMSGAYQDDPELMPQQAAQFDLAFSTQPYMEQLVSAQPSHVRLIPGNVYSDAMHVAAGLPVFPAYGYQAVAEGSTIDEAAFSSLFDTSQGGKTDQQMENSMVELEPPQPVQVSKPSATFTAPVEEDDELCNFARPPPEMADKEKPIIKPSPLALSGSNSQDAESSSDTKIKTPVKPPPGFQDSFLSFLMGKKQETLSSVTSATIGEKPQLPKYIPEPRRPAPPHNTSQDSAPLAFSDDEGEDSNMGTAVKNAISSLGHDSESDASDVTDAGYSVQRTKDLTVKITLGGNRQQSSKRGRPRGGSSVGRGRGRVEITPKPKGGPRELTPPPPRESIGRKAKDLAKVKASRKKKKHQDSGSSSGEDDSVDEEFKPKVPGIKRTGSDSESAYDSDKDPVWTPLAEEAPRRPPGFGFDPLPVLDMRPKKSKSKSKRGPPQAFRGGPQQPGEHMGAGDMSGSPAKFARVSESGDAKGPTNGASRSATATAGRPDDEFSDPNFQVGRFLLERKDQHNYESYPVWRLEHGRMLRKFEMFIDNGRILHKAVSTYSSWVPSMSAQFIPIRVLVITNKPHGEIVEVLEEFRPKPPTDGSLEVQYEDDPLVDHFNVYLQIFLSQSLEPSFLAAIRKSQEFFYLVPLEKIDKMIEAKLEQIDRTVQWKPRFRECMRMKPQMREINRPNLKQSCQACENSSPPTIKSVLFHGAPYDRFLLTDIQDQDTGSMEFLVGKLAAPYITQYHNLHHFKYRLYQRCKAKVHMVRESNKSQNIKDESILDQCLQNRAWVLKIFEDFKSLLERT